MIENESRSLKSIFDDAETKREALQNSYETTSQPYQDDLADVINAYEESLDLIVRLSLFSPNESADDISTSDLPYLLINYHLGELVQKTTTQSPLDRQQIVSRARRAYETFLRVLDTYDLLQPTQAALLEAYIENPTSFTCTPAADPNARRNSKIANFRQEKELRDKLALLRAEPHYLTRDEEAVREVHRAHLDFAAHMALQALEGINREAAVLAQAPVPLLPQTTSVREDERRRTDELRAEGERVEHAPALRRLQSAVGGGGPLLDNKGKPLQPFTILGNRGEMARNVFRPGHNLPTMSIDEYLAEERRRGGIIEGGGEASGQRPEPDEDNYDKADAETMKARAWDEYVEANPKGSGNTLNRG